MVRRHVFSRRNILRFGLGASCLALTQIPRFRSKIQALDRLFRDFTVSNPGLSLRQLAASKNLIYGAASGYGILSSDTEFSSRYIEECEILVPENDLKWSALRPGPDRFDFSGADWLLSFTQLHDLKIRGHTLVWHLALPNWFEATVNSQNAERFLISHIETVAGRYAGKMHSWDVVNEAIEIYDDHPDKLRRTPWLEFLGKDYIDLAFRVAAKADPSALLVYNDYGLEYDTPDHDEKRAAVLKLLEDLKAQGTPIGGFGMQSHLSSHELPFNPEKMRQFLANVASLGLKILVTELDVTDYYWPANLEIRDRIVAAAYEDYLNVVLDEPAVIAVLTWGLSDRYTWLSEYAPRSDGLAVRTLPLDENLNRKLAWNAIARAFENAPRATIMY